MNASTTDLKTYCATKGSQLQHTVHYYPWQNGVAERKDRTLKEMTNCMIHSKGLASQIRVKAINCAYCVQNHATYKVVQMVMPEEAWSGWKTFVSNLMIFRCNVWCHTPKEKHKAMDIQSKP